MKDKLIFRNNIKKMMFCGNCIKNKVWLYIVYSVLCVYLCVFVMYILAGMFRCFCVLI